MGVGVVKRKHAFNAVDQVSQILAFYLSVLLFVPVLCLRTVMSVFHDLPWADILKALSKAKLWMLD